MPDVRIVLVGPKFEGNVGAIARLMANFDFDDLCLVNPCEIGDDAYRRAKHGSHILEGAKTFGSLREALDGCFLVAGTSGTITKGAANYGRIPMPPEKFAESVKDYGEKIALVLGREDIGLFQEELDRCDVFVNIPSSETYPTLNLSHAAGIILYELFGTCHTTPSPEPADIREKELMFRFFEDLLDSIYYPEVRRERTALMFRKMMGRSIPTKYEYNTIMGVFGDAAKGLRDGKGRE
jgi:TrmH family RNA methyltransferase